MNDLSRTDASDSLITPSDYNRLVEAATSSLSRMPARTQIGYHLSQDVQIKSGSFVGFNYDHFQIGVSKGSQNVHQELTFTITKLD